MAKLSIDIVTPERRLLTSQVDEAILPGHDGLFGVREGHTPFLSLMQPGALTLREGTSTQVFFVGGGFVEVTNDHIRVLADAAEPALSIDVDAARKRLEEAQERLKRLNAEDARFDVETAVVRTETARIATAGKR